MNAALILEASADAYLACGDEVSAAFCRRMANDARNMGMLGQQLYRHWAGEMAERATAKLMEFNEKRKVA